jgi:flagellin-specific chaperone FliS
MDWLRSAIGIAPATPSSQQRKPNATLERYRNDTSHEERSEKFARAQLMRIDMLKEELRDEEADAKAAVARKDRVAAQQHLMRAKKVRSELQTLQKKHDNMRQTQGAIQNANSNVAQGVLVQEGAAELESAVNALEEIDWDAAVDALQEAASVMEEHDTRLTEPIFNNGGVVDEYEVDEELDRMMQEQEERDALAATANLPDIHHATPPVPDTTVPQMEENAELKN